MDRSRIAQAMTGAALAGLVVLTASSSQAEPPRAEHASTRDTLVTPGAMDQETYLATIRGLLAGKDGASQSDDDLIAGGKSICSDIDAGATSATFEKQIVDYGLDRAVYRTVIRASIMTFCPEDSAQVIR
jgi:hypothetical protein